MDPELLLLGLRLLAALALYAFLALILLALGGESLPWGRRQTASPPALLRLESPEAASFPLSEMNSLGRAADNTIHLAFERVSAHHARLGFRRGQWWLEDLGSTNGTRVNDLTVDQPLVVTYGDRILIGDVCLVLEHGQRPSSSN